MVMCTHMHITVGKSRYSELLCTQAARDEMRI